MKDELSPVSLSEAFLFGVYVGSQQMRDSGFEFDHPVLDAAARDEQNTGKAAKLLGIAGADRKSLVQAAAKANNDNKDARSPSQNAREKEAVAHFIKRLQASALTRDGLSRSALSMLPEGYLKEWNLLPDSS